MNAGAPPGPTRRGLLLSAAATGGALLIGWGWLPPRSRVGTADTLPAVEGEIGINGWIKIGGDGRVMLAMPRSEMGQGVHTALAQLAAEELDIEAADVLIVPASLETLHGNVALVVDALPLADPPGRREAPPFAVRAGQWLLAKVGRELGLVVTGGSSSVIDAFGAVPLAAATARAQLLGAAALAFRLPIDEFTVGRGRVHHPSGEEAHFGELAAQAALTPPGDVRLKPRASWRVVGRPVPRLDVPAKCNGSARFGLDVRLPGMVFAVVRHAPTLGGSPGRVDAEAALAFPGVERVVRLPPYGGGQPALAVVGRSTWHAAEGARRLVVEWQPRPGAPADSKAARAALEAAVQAPGGIPYAWRGDAQAALASAARRISAVYHAPYLAHAAMEPLNCTAQVEGGRVTLWLPTQVPGFARALAARVAGVDEDAVAVHVTYLGGGFGRRLEVDVVGQAVRVALETAGRPVQLVWPREEDSTHDFYRPANSARLEAGFGADGRLAAVAIRCAGDAISPRWVERVLPQFGLDTDAPDRTAVDGFLELPYDVPHLHLAHLPTRLGVPVGMWRSVGHSHQAFFAEAFVDELAGLADADPVAFRLGLLRDRPRHAAVLRAAADRAGWGGGAPAGRARGVALHASYHTIVAMVVEASIERGEPRVHRVVCALDCGTVVNPGIVAQQVESGVIFGLGAALYGRIDITQGEVQQKNFPDLGLLALRQTPAIETHLVGGDGPPGGVGEVAVPPVAPALANALFALDRVRRRELPFAAAATRAV